MHTHLPGMGKLASPARRLGAAILDLFIPGAIIIAIIGGSIASGSAALFVIAILAYFVWAIVLFATGRTPGKKLLGIQVYSESGRPADFVRMFIRETIGKWISGLVFGLGWIWILIDKDRQGWHDKLVTTYVVEPGTTNG